MQQSLQKHWILLCYALSFFTRVPVPQSTNFNAFPFHWGNVYFPVIGLLHACLCFAVFFISHLFLDNTSSVILMLVAGVLFTGAFHEDGFADSCDGFGGGYSKKQRLLIMTDSRIGTYGSLGLILLFALKINLLSHLSVLSPMTFWAVLISSAVLSRGSALCLMQLTHYARGDESSKSIQSSQRLPHPYFISALLLSLLAVLWLPLPWLLLIIAVVALSTSLSSAYFKRHIEGYTGDCLGFVQQLNELLILILLMVFFQ